MNYQPHSAGPWNRAVPGRVHLVGAAGAGMSALADILAAQGWRVTGSDVRRCKHVTAAAPAHSPDHVSADIDLLVHSDAIPADNCERRRARELGIAEQTYAEVVAELARSRRTMAVAGAHGKSTASAMAAAILLADDGDPTIVCGAKPSGWDSGGRAGRDDWMLVEACEFRRNFLRYRPEVAAILNVELDHFDCYRDAAELEAAFAEFVARSDRVVLNADCPAARRVARGAAGESFSISGPADWTAGSPHENAGHWSFDLVHNRRVLGRVRLRIAGRHNIANALAAAALAATAGVDDAALVAGLNQFAGLARRLEVHRLPNGVRWVDDFAHHPTEVGAALAAARTLCPAGRVWGVFQPHQHTRTRRLLDEFALSLRNCDHLFIADIYRAREAPAAGEIQAADLAQAVRRLGGPAANVHALAEIEAALALALSRSELTSADLIITMGAGDVDRIGRGLARSARRCEVLGSQG